MIFDNYEKVGEYKDGKLTWLTDNRYNVVYGISFPDGGSYIGSSKDLRKRFSIYVPAWEI